MHRYLAFLLLVSLSSVAAGAAPRSVSVMGSGEASAAPDHALVRMAINARAKELADAQAAAARVVAAVLELTDRLDIERDRVDTTGATVQPDYRWNRSSEEQELRGYIAGRNLIVRVTELDALGPLIEGAVEAGVNQVSPPQILSSGRKAAERNALAGAAEDARAKADALARTLGARLGAVLEIEAIGNTPAPNPFVRMAAASTSEDAAATYNAGDMTVRASARVTFELQDD